MKRYASLGKRFIMLAYCYGILSGRIVAAIFRMCGWLKGA
jgi:hypothetical protein